MERRVPSTASEEIQLYLQTVYSLLRSTAEVKIRTLEEIHAGMNSSLHPDARKTSPDISALVYGLLRLPDCMPEVKRVVMGQSAAIFQSHGYGNVEKWEEVSAKARRRRTYFDRKDTLACFIASRSDIDDVVPMLTAYQIEWNKLHILLQNVYNSIDWDDLSEGSGNFNKLAEDLEMQPEDLSRLKSIWGEDFVSTLQQIANHKCRLQFRLLSGSLTEYWRVTRNWLDNVTQKYPALNDHPIYFISSNTHSMVNLITGFALQHQEELVRFIQQDENTELLNEWQNIQTEYVPSSQNNFLYYVFKKYVQTKAGKHLLKEQTEFERERGIIRVPSSKTAFDVEAQIIDLSKINLSTMDPRLCEGNWDFLNKTNALILNIDYPLGLSAYNILAKAAEHLGPIQGIYIIGKAASLNGVHGDVIIPTVVFDEHSQNTYMFRNALKADDVAPYLVYGTVLDNQKAVTVLGTFLQNARVMDVIYKESYTDIEMEAGPYLSAIYEMYRPKRHPTDEIVSLHRVPFDLGMLHYASDTPMSKGKNLGAGSLSYYGMDSTYATSLAVLKRIFQVERERAASQI